MKLAILLLSAVALHFGCQTERAMDKEAIERQVMAVIRDGETGWNQGDIEHFMQQYWQSDSMRFASGGVVAYGWQQVLERYKQGYPDKATMGKLTFSELDVTVLGADAAMVFGRWQLNREEDAPAGLFTLILRKKPEGWRIVHDHTSSARTQ